MDNQAFNDYLNNVRTNAASAVIPPATQQPTQQTQPQQGGGGNWFTHLLPTAGGILGGIVGIPGDLISGGAASVAGAGAGSALGKGIENALEGKSAIQGNDLTAGAEGAIGQGVGGLVGKALGAGGELLANRAGNIANAAKDTQGLAAGLENNKVLNAIYGSSKNDVGHAANMAQQAGLDMANPEQLQNAGKMLLENTGGTLDSIVGTTKVPISGVVDESGAKLAPSIDDLIHSSLTNTSPLTGEKLGASRSLVLGGLGPNQTDEDLLRNGYTRFLSSSAKNGTNTPATGFLKEANQLLSGVNHGSTASAHDLLEAQRLVGDKAQSMAQAAAKPSANEVTQAQSDAWKDLNYKLQDMIYSHPDVSQAAKDMVGTHSAEDFGGNQALADLFNNRITGAQSGKDLNALMHDAYNLRDVGKEGLDVINNPASTGTLKLAKINAAEPGATGSNGAQMASDIHGAQGITGKALALGSHAANNPQLLGTLSRMGALTSKLAPTAGVVAATAPNLGAAPAGMQQQSNIMGAAMQPAQQSPLDQLYSTLLSQEQNGAGLTANSGSIISALQALAPQVQKNNLVSNELSALPGAYANAGGAQGAGGILSRISGLIPGTAAHTYQQQQEGAAQALAAQLGISPQAAAGLLPQLMQNQGTAGMNQGVLSQLGGQLAY